MLDPTIGQVLVFIMLTACDLLWWNVSGGRGDVVQLEQPAGAGGGGGDVQPKEQPANNPPAAAGSKKNDEIPKEADKKVPVPGQGVFSC